MVKIGCGQRFYKSVSTLSIGLVFAAADGDSSPLSNTEIPYFIAGYFRLNPLLIIFCTLLVPICKNKKSVSFNIKRNYETQS